MSDTAKKPEVVDCHVAYAAINGKFLRSLGVWFVIAFSPFIYQFSVNNIIPASAIADPDQWLMIFFCIAAVAAFKIVGILLFDNYCPNCKKNPMRKDGIQTTDLTFCPHCGARLMGDRKPVSAA